MPQDHHYALRVQWTGNLGRGTDGYRAYSRDHEVRADGLPTLLGSSDPAFRGDPARWNPEQLFLASVSQCHLLWYLHLATVAGVVVVDYEDHATALMVEDETGAGRFTDITLHPQVTIADATRRGQAEDLHDEVGRWCYIARSLNFPIHHQVTVHTT